MAETLGQRLRRLRKENTGLSIEDVARRLNISFSSIAKYERDEQEPSIDRLKELAALYKVSLATLLGEDHYDKESNQRFIKFGDLLIDGEQIELYRKVGKTTEKREEAATVEKELTDQEKQLIEDLKVLQSVDMLAAHMSEDAYDKPLEPDVIHSITNAIREVRRRHGKNQQ